MLVLSRHVGETIHIDGGITITVVRLEAGKVRLGITAPDDMNIWRGELPQRPEGQGDAAA